MMVLTSLAPLNLRLSCIDILQAVAVRAAASRRLAGRLDVVSVAARCGSKDGVQLRQVPSVSSALLTSGQEPSRQDAQQRSVDPPKWRPLQAHGSLGIRPVFSHQPQNRNGISDEVSARLLSSHAASCTKGASSLVHLVPWPKDRVELASVSQWR